MIVADCSALVPYLTHDGDLGRVARKRVGSADALAAPDVIDAEIMSAVLGMAKGRRGGVPKLTERQADKALATFQLLPIARHGMWPALGRIKQLAANLSVYDAQYVALAEALGAPLLTCDARIKRCGVARCLVEVVAA